MVLSQLIGNFKDAVFKSSHIFYLFVLLWGFPGGSVVKNLPANAGDLGDAGSIPGLGRSPGGEHDSPLQYSCLEDPMDRGAWWATVHGDAKIWM